MSAATRQALAYGDEWLAKTIEGLENERDFFKATNRRTTMVEGLLIEHADDLPAELIRKLPPDLCLTPGEER